MDRESTDSTQERESTDSEDAAGVVRQTTDVGQRIVVSWGQYPSMTSQYDDDEAKWIMVTGDGGLGEIVDVDYLTEEYDEIDCPQPNANFVIGTLVSQDRQEKELVYAVQLDSGDVITLRRLRIFDKLFEKMNRINNFELEDRGNSRNLVSRKRRISPSVEDGEPCIKRQDDSTESLDTNGEEEIAEIVSRKRKSTSEDNLPGSKRCKETPPVTGSSAPPSKVSTGLGTDPVEESADVFCVNAEQQTESSHISSVSGSYENSSRFTSDFTYETLVSETLETLDSLYGPLPPEGSELFMGKTIIVSATKSDAEFTWPLLIQRITSGGGTLTTEMPAPFTENVILVSNSYTRTRNYIKALALGLPCVSYEWIVNSCRENTLLPYENYLLPAGKMIDGKIVQWHGKKGIFGGCTCLVLAIPGTDVSNFWSDILSSAGSLLVDHVAIPTGPKVFLVMVDKSYSRLNVNILRSVDVHVRTTDWITECLIRGKIIRRMRHKEYTTKAFR